MKKLKKKNQGFGSVEEMITKCTCATPICHCGPTSGSVVVDISNDSHSRVTRTQHSDEPY